MIQLNIFDGNDGPNKPVTKTDSGKKEEMSPPRPAGEKKLKMKKKEEPVTAPKAPVKVNKRGRKSYQEMDAAMVHVQIPPDEQLFQKQYYAISEVADWFNVNASLIRFWENEFVILKPRKNKKGDRLFRPEDVKNLELIYHLLRERKFSIEGAKQYLLENHAKALVNLQTIQSLSRVKFFLLELKAGLDMG